MTLTLARGGALGVTRRREATLLVGVRAGAQARARVRARARARGRVRVGVGVGVWVGFRVRIRVPTTLTLALTRLCPGSAVALACIDEAAWLG